MVKGNFYPVSYKRNTAYFSLQENNQELFRYLSDEKSTIVCINDTIKDINFEKVAKELIDNFERKLPEKSSFEK